MDLISNGTQISPKPVPAAVTGTPGYATAGNATTGLPRTIIDPDNYNLILDELSNVVIASGQALNKANATQLLTAIIDLVGPNVKNAFSQSLTLPGWMKLPNGILIQWGNGTTSGSSSTGTMFSFPVTFPNGAFVILANDAGNVSTGSNTGHSVGISIDSPSAFNVIGYVGGSITLTTFNWLAIGY